MRIQLLGGTDERSSGCVLIESAGHSILVDPGLHEITPETISTIQGQGDPIATIITHAHADHIGGLPLVVEAFPNAQIFATPPTLALLKILLPGLLTLDQGPEYSPANSAEPAVRPVWTRSVQFREPVALSGRDGEEIGWKLTFLAAGHVLGAAMAYLQTPEGTVLVTGDVFAAPQHTVPRNARPHLSVDVLVLESTNGDRTYRPREAEESELINLVHLAQDRGGHVLIATSPLGTAQEILIALALARLQGRIAGNIWIDGQVRDVNLIYSTFASEEYPRLARFIAEHGNPFSHANPFARVVENAADRRAILAGIPAVVLTTTPSLAAGPSQYYARALAQRRKHMVLMPEQINNVQFPTPILDQGGPRCTVERYGISMHSDREALTSFVTRLHPKRTLLVHGISAARRKLGAQLTELGLANYIPSPGESVIQEPSNAENN